MALLGHRQEQCYLSGLGKIFSIQDEVPNTGDLFFQFDLPEITYQFWGYKRSGNRLIKTFNHLTKKY